MTVKDKIVFFGTVILTRNTIKDKFIYNGREIAFDGAGLWSFGIVFARNIMVFGVDNISSSHTDNRENMFLSIM